MKQHVEVSLTGVIRLWDAKYVQEHGGNNLKRNFVAVLQLLTPAGFPVCAKS